MKSILYVAAMLMTGACIYGFVDYNKTKNSKEFAAMYDEKENIDPAITNEKEPVNAASPVSSDEGPAGVAVIATGKEEKKKKEGSAGKSRNKKAKKKRKINYENFSRAPLREEVLIEIPEIKEEIKKEQ